MRLLSESRATAIPPILVVRPGAAGKSDNIPKRRFDAGAAAPNTTSKS